MRKYYRKEEHDWQNLGSAERQEQVPNLCVLLLVHHFVHNSGHFLELRTLVSVERIVKFLAIGSVTEHLQVSTALVSVLKMQR